jgi:hypothetical protein
MDPSTFILVLATLMWVLILIELNARSSKLSATETETCIHHLVSPELLEAVASGHSIECTSDEVCETPDALLKRVLGLCMEPLRGVSMSNEEFDQLVDTEWKKFVKVEYKRVSI